MRPKFINNQNFYFHFHYKLFCIKAVHLSNKLWVMYPRLWPIEHNICIGLYVLKCLLNVRHILEKVMSMQHSFEEFSDKQRRVELKSVGNFVVKAVLFESANQFSLEDRCRTQYSLKYFRSHIDHQTLWKNLNVLEQGGHGLWKTGKTGKMNGKIGEYNKNKKIRRKSGNFTIAITKSWLMVVSFP